MKQRLVGAIVLVALAVIFLPMVLDGSGDTGPRDIAIEIPPEPEPPANRLDRPRDFTDTGLARHAEAGGGEREATRSGTDGGAQQSEASAAADGGDAGSAAEASGEGGASAGEDGVAGDGGAAGPTPDAPGWVVQVGSFTQETNALVLRDRLRASDYDAFAERTESGERTLWRVRIGPIATEKEASRLSERLSEERGEPALVLSRP